MDKLKKITLAFSLPKSFSVQLNHDVNLKESMVVEKTLREKLTDVIETLPAESITLASFGHAWARRIPPFNGSPDFALHGARFHSRCKYHLRRCHSADWFQRYDRSWAAIAGSVYETCLSSWKTSYGSAEGVVWLHRLERISRPRLSRLSQGSAIARWMAWCW